MNVMVLGTGSLARSVCYSLAAVPRACGVVTVASRTPESAAELCYVAGARAAAGGVDVRFDPVTVAGYSAGEAARVQGAAGAVVVLNCASLQSPWEGVHSPSAWTDFMGRAGYGVTMPLQAAVAAEVASGVAAAGALFVNACLPDAVNPLLDALGLPVFCGAGNVATLAASLRAALRAAPQSRLQVVAHHWHLHSPPDESEEALAWLDGEPVRGLGPMLAAQRATTRSELNAVTGHVTALLLADLAEGREIRANLPGPLGLPGGYPVHISGRELELDLPAGMRDEALAANRRWSGYDGVGVEPGGAVVFGERAAAEIGRTVPELADGFHARDLPAVRARLLDLRCRLRDAPTTREAVG